MNLKKALQATVSLVVALMSSFSALTSAENSLGLVPLPAKIERFSGEWAWQGTVGISASKELPGAIAAAHRLLGSSIPLEHSEAEEAAALRIRFNANLNDEAYTLNIDQTGVDIHSSSDAGVFYALHTLRQLMPISHSEGDAADVTLAIPYLKIEDHPRFGWRGMHLDVARHFMPVEFVKKFIDALSLHKFNRFHWHLTDDQGWRIEIKQYPKLTEIGSKRAQTVVGFSLFDDESERKYDGVPHGGFYSQEQIRDIVAYAAERHITIVPEIEFPGHAVAAIASYPELGNTGAQLKVKEEWGISKNTIKPSEETLVFYKNVLGEVIDLFPSQHIHIGGDEAPKDQWKESAFAQQRIKALGLKDEKELQSWLIQQIDDFLSANGRTLVGWDEIMQGGLSSNATVMAWRGLSRGEKAAAAGHDVVMAPTSHTYFDYYQADSSIEPLAIGSYISLEKVYGFDPMPAGLAAAQRKHILGGQGQLWTEFMKTPEHVEYMAFPRAVALAEVLWSPADKRDFDGFKQRLDVHLPRLEAMQLNYRAPGNDELSLGNSIKAWLLNRLIGVYHWYTDL